MRKERKEMAAEASNGGNGLPTAPQANGRSSPEVSSPNKVTMVKRSSSGVNLAHPGPICPDNGKHATDERASQWSKVVGAAGEVLIAAMAESLKPHRVGNLTFAK